MSYRQVVRSSEARRKAGSNQGDFNVIVQLGSGLASVAEAAPGDPGFRGGRWEVHRAT